MSRQASLVGSYISLLLFMVIYCSRPEDWIPVLRHAPLAKVTGILALLALVFSIQHIRLHLPREVLYLALLIGELFLASALSPVWRGGALQATLGFAKVLAIVIVMAMVVTTGRRLRQLIFIQASSMAVIALVAVLKSRLVLGRLEGTLGGSFSDPNDLALTIIISLPLCLVLLFLSRNWLWKAAWALAMLVMLYAVVLTGSRGGFIALIFTSAIFLWEFSIRGRRRYLLVLAVLLGVTLWQLSGGVLVERFKGTLNPNEETAATASSQARKELFWRSIEVTKEHPLLGVGPGNFQQVSGSWHVTHNSYTQMSAEGGVPALILYALILWSGFKNVKAVKRYAKGQREANLMAKALSASLVGYCVGSLFLSVSYGFFPYFLVAYTSALLLIAKNSAAQSKHKPASQEKSAKENFAPLQGAIDSPAWAR